MMKFVQIEYQSGVYDQEIQLRDALLRRPLGLEISDADIKLDATQMHFGILQDDILVACIVAVDLGDQHAKLRQMAVLESHQRRGIGSNLIRATESHLRKLGFKTLELSAREPAIPFYEKLGYLPMGERFEEVTIPHQKMFCNL